MVRLVVNARVAGRYQLVREIGAGGMGRVFQALDMETGATVAAKMLMAGDEVSLDALIRFQTEGAVLSALKHPNIVQVYSTHLEDHISCIIMEFLEGRSLGQILRVEKLSLARTKHIMGQVATALTFAHSRGVVHRDVKPDNIMVIGDDHVKVTDFGIARVLQEGNTLRALTVTGASMGTPLYMAPEQIEGQRVDGRTDIYAFGVVLFQMVTGRPPFEGDDPLTVAFKHVHKAPPAPADMNPEVPSAWEEVILTCLAKDPARRYQSAAALEAAISALDTAPTVGLPRRSPATGPAQVTQPETQMLEHETRTLLDGARQKELAGRHQEALSAYRTALTIASPGPIRDELEAGVRRLSGATSLFPPGQVPPGTSVPATSTSQSPWSLHNRPAQLGLAGGLLALLLVVAFLVNRLQPGPGPDRSATATAAAVAAGATAAAEASATAGAQETAAAGTQETATVIAQTFNPSSSRFPQTVAGPLTGSLTDPRGNSVAFGNPTRTERDFAAMIRFRNPAGANWDYGFAFRNIGTNKQYRLVVSSDGKWYLVYGIERSTQSGASSAINTGAGRINQIEAVVSAANLRLSINGHFVANVAVPRVQTGTLNAISDIFSSDSAPGRTAHFDRFTVWSAAPAAGPMSGQIAYGLNNTSILFQQSGARVRDFVAEARFTNPYQATRTKGWDYGFSFRETGVNHQFRIVVTSAGRWRLAYGPASDLANGPVPVLRTGPRQSNDLRLVVQGPSGGLFVNGSQIGVFNLGSHVVSGGVDVLTAAYLGDGVSGKSLHFKNFVVWSLDR